MYEEPRGGQEQPFGVPMRDPSPGGASWKGGVQEDAPGGSRSGPSPSVESSRELLAELLDALSVVTRNAGRLKDHIVVAGSAQLHQLMECLGGAALAIDAAEIVVAAEAFERGEPASASPPTTPVGWVKGTSPRYSLMGAARVAKLAQACQARNVVEDGQRGFADAVTSGDVCVPSGAAVVAQMERLTPLLNPEAVSAAWGAFTVAASVSTPTGIAGFREQFLARFAGPDALERPATRARQAVALSRPVRAGDGLFDYRLTLDAEAMATLEAALGPVSVPAPNPETKEPDTRSEARRRAEGLIQLVNAGIQGAEPGNNRSAHLFITIPADDLIPRAPSHATAGTADAEGSPGIDVTAGTASSRAAASEVSSSRRGAGTVLGSTAPETTLLPLSSLIKLACDAYVTPVITFPDGSPMSLGRTTRLFTAAQYRALVLRDRGCTFPGCGAPATWTRTHHLHHWTDGGPSDLSNATLLCQRHHTIVHTHRYHGWVDTDEQGQRVRWDLTRGSYDAYLARIAPPQSDALPQSDKGPLEPDEVPLRPEESVHHLQAHDAADDHGQEQRLEQ